MKFRFIVFAAALLLSTGLSAQKYPGGLVDKTVAVVGNEVILVSDIESEVQQMQAQGRSSDRDMRCTILERMMENKIFLMQARIDSLTVNYDMVDGELSNRIDQYRTYLGGDEEVEKQFGKPLYKLRQEWRKLFEDQSLIQSEQGEIAGRIPEVTPYDVQQFLDTVSVEDLPVVPIKYQLSQICIYPDREAAAMAVKERLLSLRERVINGEKFATLARIYSEDPGSARRGGELGMASKSIFWPAFSDAAMALRPGVISQIVETPDGFHIIEVIEKKGDMFNARHILLKPQYTAEDREKAFSRLDSLRTKILDGEIKFNLTHAGRLCGHSGAEGRRDFRARGVHRQRGLPAGPKREHRVQDHPRGQDHPCAPGFVHERLHRAAGPRAVDPADAGDRRVPGEEDQGDLHRDRPDVQGVLLQPGYLARKVLIAPCGGRSHISS